MVVAAVLAAVAVPYVVLAVLLGRVLQREHAPEKVPVSGRFGSAGSRGK